ncbi:MAG TPA: hypothetical protein VKB20_10555 [Steroidobacteraceae bacterium]|nr:hypothetical protein [Steroidobacteraceae bacterium]
MDSYVPFLARCPKCGYEWLQDGYTRCTLLQLLDSSASIDAYCMRCAVSWPISRQEQQALSAELAR